MQEFIAQYRQNLSEQDLSALIQLNMTKGIGGVLFQRLVDTFATIENIRCADKEEFLAVRGIGPKNADALFSSLKIDARKELAYAQEHQYQVISIFDSAYPKALLNLYDPPLVIFVKGELIDQDKLAIGIVGSRGPTSYGRFQAEKFAMQLAGAGFTIVSGLAMGIDTCAHRGALHGEGRTIAVLGNGFGTCYPQDNKALLEEIGEKGAVITEYPFNTPPKGNHFPSRNRIVAALSLGVLVVEARINSGSLITARMAADLGKEIFALPGQVSSLESEGTHKLIVDGARLVTRAEDILEELGELETILKPVLQKSNQDFAMQLTDEERFIIETIGSQKVHFEEILAKSIFDVSELLSYLTLLEIKGLVKAKPGKYYQCLT